MTYEEIVKKTAEYILSIPDKSNLTMGDAVNCVSPDAFHDVINPLNYGHLQDIIDAVEKTETILDYTAHDDTVGGAPFNMDFIVRKKRLQKAQIISNLMCFGPYPESDEPIEQRLTISSSGQIWFTEYLFGDPERGKHPIGRKMQFSIGKEKAAELLSLIADYVESESEVVFATDIGTWDLTATYPDGSKNKLEGSMCGGVAAGGVDLTKRIRCLIPIEDLAVFDLD